MRILVFTEGTLLIHRDWIGLSREEMVERVRAGRGPGDYAGSVPVGGAAGKLHTWKRQGAEICYLTSRRTVDEVGDVQGVLIRHGFPAGELFFRLTGETYGQVAERIAPDVLIEDDCESIGGEQEMTYPQISPDARRRITPIVVKEFGGIDHLPDDLAMLRPS